MYSWVKGIQVCLNEGHCPFPRGDHGEIGTFINLNHWPNFNQTYHKASMGEWNSCSNEVSCPFQGEIIATLKNLLI